MLYLYSRFADSERRDDTRHTTHDTHLQETRTMLPEQVTAAADTLESNLLDLADALSICSDQYIAYARSKAIAHGSYLVIVLRSYNIPVQHYRLLFAFCRDVLNRIP